METQHALQYQEIVLTVRLDIFKQITVVLGFGTLIIKKTQDVKINLINISFSAQTMAISIVRPDGFATKLPQIIILIFHVITPQFPVMAKALLAE